MIKTDDEQYWVSMSFPSERVDTVLTLSELNKKISGKDLKHLPRMHWLDEGLIYYRSNNKLKMGVLTGGGYQWMNWVTLPKHAANVTVDKSKNIAYTIDNNLHMVDRNGKVLEVTNDKNKHIVNGQSVHRNEFGIGGGIFFSPEGNYLAYYHMDESMVNDYPVVDWSKTPAKTRLIKYPMAGGTSHEVKLHVFNPRTGNTVVVNTEGPERPISY